MWNKIKYWKQPGQNLYSSYVDWRSFWTAPAEFTLAASQETILQATDRIGSNQPCSTSTIFPTNCVLRFSTYWKSLVGVRLNCTGTNILGIATLWKSLRKKITWIVNTLHFHFSAEATLRDFIFRITRINNTLNHIVPATFMRRNRIQCFWRRILQ